jgi:hypothetical protein
LSRVIAGHEKTTSLNSINFFQNKVGSCVHKSDTTGV